MLLDRLFEFTVAYITGHNVLVCGQIWWWCQWFRDFFLDLFHLLLRFPAVALANASILVELTLDDLGIKWLGHARAVVPQCLRWSKELQRTQADFAVLTLADLQQSINLAEYRTREIGTTVGTFSRLIQYKRMASSHSFENVHNRTRLLGDLPF